MRRASTERNRVSLGVEALEGRLLLAGNVTVKFDGDTLVAKGDNKDNCVEISANKKGELEIVGCNKTTINGSKKAFTTSKEIDEFEIWLYKGNDELTVKDVKFSGDVAVHMNEGKDKVTVDSCQFSGDVDLGLGQDNDEISVKKSKFDDGEIEGGDLPKGNKDTFNDNGGNSFGDVECTQFEKGC